MEFSLMGLVNNLTTDWKDDERFMSIVEDYSNSIDLAMIDEYRHYTIYPSRDDVLNAFNHFDIQDLKVVILSQDPYINEDEAMGLCFSVPNGNKCPPSLRNIFKELQAEYNEKRTDSDLTDWAEQGVLLMNRSLTVRSGMSLSHIKIWKQFTEDVLKYISLHYKNIVYILWGKNAQDIKKYIDTEKNLVLEHSHPSPLSRKPFIGNNHFKLCNEYLVSIGKPQIKWL